MKYISNHFLFFVLFFSSVWGDQALADELGQDLQEPQQKLDIKEVFIIPSTPYALNQENFKSYLKDLFFEKEPNLLNALNIEQKIKMTNDIFTEIGSDFGEWKRLNTFLRASLWFHLGKNELIKKNYISALNAFQKTKTILELGDILIRPPLMSSLCVLSGDLLYSLGEIEESKKYFTTAVFFSRDDDSFSISNQNAKLLYLSIRKNFSLIKKQPVKITINQKEGTLFLNGTEINGKGPNWWLELPVGEHVITALSDTTRPTSIKVKIEDSVERIPIKLELEQGKLHKLAKEPFSLANITRTMAELKGVIQKKSIDEIIFLVVVDEKKKIIHDEKLDIVKNITGIRKDTGPSEDINAKKESFKYSSAELFSLKKSGDIVLIKEVLL